MTSKLTRERLVKIKSWREIYGAGSNVMLPAEEAEELACIALAAMDSEPVAYMHDGEDGTEYNGHDEFSGGGKGIPLYRHAQPAPEREQLAIENFRSAIEGIGHIRRTLEETFGGLHGTHVEPDVLMDCKTICDAIYAAYSGNSPVIPDGYVMAPREPTEEMNKAGWAAMNEHDAINPTYRAMIAAAPHETPALNSVQSVATVPGKWVPVSEQMPEVGVKVLCFPVKDEPIHATFNGQLWLQDVSWCGSEEPIDNVIPVTVTHWMPLPAAPQEPKP
ncbi:hypothetical protein E3AUHO_21410 [Klebsiella pneumoniae subsp. pneumoniae]|nr:hypothetical protein E3AUHO_21410 [Klebsiella pneumoniae subsp. pneumoniae]